MSFLWRPSLGASPEQTGVRFAVWAPNARRVQIELGRGDLVELEPGADGSFEAHTERARAGSDYFVVLDGEKRRADPLSRFQPEGVHGPSRVIDPSAFAWTDAGWRGIAREDLILYELHVGTFTPAGTFEAAIEKLDHLVDLGVTAIEVMPIAEFPGRRNWGYDGVNLYAPQSSYGGPDGFKRLVDACHARGLGVVLDVVYNHLGPEGNHLADFGPYFSDRYRTPWGLALNFDAEGSDWVRRYFVDNAVYWLVEFHVDGLRLDAVHAIHDQSAKHVLAEIAEEFHAVAAKLGRSAALIAESDLNATRVTRSRETGGWALDAQWSDDFHHSLFARVSGADHGYFADFGTLADLVKAIKEGFVYDGRRSEFRQRKHGESAADRPGAELVVFSQNHDQIANASHGHRLADKLSPAAERLAAAVLLAAPNLVMLFQGQEWGESARFDYFTDHGDPDLVRAVREGRAAEYRGLGLERELRDPQAEATFLESRLDWEKLRRDPHAGLLALHRDLIALRKTTPALANCRKDLVRCRFDEDAGWLVVERSDPAGSRALVVANFAREPRRIAVSERARFRQALFTLDARYGLEAPASSPPQTIESGATIELAAESAVVYLAAG